MENSEQDMTQQDRVEDFLAVINMIGYAMGVAQDLGVKEAASDLQAAGLKLASEVQRENSWKISSQDVLHLANTQTGRC